MAPLKTQQQIEQENLEMVRVKMTQEIGKARKSGTLADLNYSHAVMPHYVNELTSRLKLYLAEMMLGGARVKPTPAKLLLALPLEVVAQYTVKSMINIMGVKSISNTRMFFIIGKLLKVEHDLGRLRKSDKKVFNRFISYIKTSGYTGKRRVKITSDLLVKYHKEALGGDQLLNFSQLAQVAVYLLSECKPMVHGETMPPLLHIEPSQYKVFIRPSTWFLEWVQQQVIDGTMLPSYHTAMVEPPRPWVSMRSGGFHTEAMRLDFIKTGVEHDKFDFNKMKDTVRAVNSLQETPWQINSKVLEVMQYAFENRLDWGYIPVPKEVLAAPYPFPKKKREDLNERELKRVKQWAQHKAAQHDEQVATTSKYLLLARVLGEAKRFKPYPNIYFTYQVDFRGRIYPAAGNLHPQGSEHVKALLQFSNGKKIKSRQGEMYLALQGANTYGQDKIRLEEKHEWVLRNHDEILASAKDPYNTDFWKQADEPWLFLAFCFEWSQYSQDPVHFESRLPIALDGTCNGLQHLSAMLRDEVGGKAVNLTNNYNKEDIYNEVRLVAIKLLEQDDSPLAKKVLEFGIERATCKRPVMIVPYAGTQNACRKYIGDDLEERGGKQFFKEDYVAAQNLITYYVWQAISEVVIKGREIMQWFKQAARAIIKYDYRTDMEWSTPNGFQVIQRRVKGRTDVIQTHMGDNVRLSLSHRSTTDKTDTSGHTTAVSPNYIHSLDACALQNTVNACVSLGVTDLAMIHDSYGSHAETAAQLSHTLREEFVKMYRRDLLCEWIAQQPEQARALFPELPETGELDIEEVLDSEHFFS